MPEEENYEVEKILQHQRRGRRVEYLVRWEGFGPEQDCWEAHGDLTADVILAYRRAISGATSKEDAPT